MSKSYSVAEARRHLPKLLHDVEDGQQVEITRRGTPVAVVISLSDYQRLADEGSGFAWNYAAWRRSISEADLEIADDYFEGLRDRTRGREVDI